MMDFNEREEALRKMDQTVERFHTAAQQTKDHSFIEFAAVMTLYVKACRRAHEQDIDFTECSRSSISSLPMQPHEVSYLTKKLDGIFGVHQLPKDIGVATNRGGIDRIGAGESKTV